MTKLKNGWITTLGHSQQHYVDNQLHNDNGPAEIWFSGTQFWFKHGRCHREDGPAIEYYNGKKSWWHEGKQLGTSWEGYTQEKFEAWKRFPAFL